MNTNQQDSLTLRRITVWEKLFVYGHGKHSTASDTLSDDERRLYIDLTATIYNDLVLRQRQVATPTPAYCTVRDAAAFAMQSLCGDAAYLNQVGRDGFNHNSIPIDRVRQIITTALKSVYQPPQP